MGILLGIKKYFYLAVGVVTTVFLGWVYFLKKDNEAKEEKIEDMEYEAEVVEKVHEQKQKVAEFKGAVEANEGSLDVKIKKAQEEYDKVKEKMDAKDIGVDDKFTFA